MSKEYGDWYSNFICSSLAGITASLFGHPLDTVKVTNIIILKRPEFKQDLINTKKLCNHYSR
jgi:hypothetical protein